MARSFTRRDFLSGSLGVGAAGALHATLGPVGPVVRLGSGARTRAIATGATSGKPHKSAKVELTLVLCTLYGGNDGLNTVVPYESSAYRALRGQIAIAHDQALPLGKAGDIALGLNPVMVGLKALWDAGQVAIVLGVGYPNPNFSHFESMEIMQSADPSGDSTSGWVGRWLDAAALTRPAPCPSGRISRRCSPGRASRRPRSRTSTTPGSQLPGGDPAFMSAYSELEHPYAHEPALEAAVAQAGSNLLVVGRKAASALTEQKPPNPVSANSAGDVGNQLDIVAELIKAGMPTKTYGVMFSSFDTHTDQLETQNGLLSQLDAGVQNFMGDFQAVSGGLSPVIVIYSEFGRRRAVECKRRHRSRHGEQHHRRGSLGKGRLLRRTTELDQVGRLAELGAHNGLPACLRDSAG